jgi:hypothetical protein
MSVETMLEPLFGGERNLGMGERGLYLTVGLGLAAAGATPRPNPLLNVLALAGGAYLVASGYYGRCPVRSAITGGGQGRITHQGMGQGMSGRIGSRSPAYDTV